MDPDRKLSGGFAVGGESLGEKSGTLIPFLFNPTAAKHYRRIFSAQKGESDAFVPALSRIQTKCSKTFCVVKLDAIENKRGTSGLRLQLASYLLRGPPHLLPS